MRLIRTATTCIKVCLCRLSSVFTTTVIHAEGLNRSPTGYYCLWDSVEIEPLAVVELPDVRACLGFIVPEHQPGESAQKHQHDKPHPGRLKEARCANQIQGRRAGDKRVHSENLPFPKAHRFAPTRSVLFSGNSLN